jgi:hypothetical protein
MTDRRFKPSSSSWNRREFLTRTGMGLGGLALADLLARDRVALAGGRDRTLGPHFAPKAKSVIWLFMQGGLSQLESFDPKPALNTYAGKSISETPHAGVLNSPFVAKNVQSGARQLMQQIYPLQVGFRKCGQSGIEMSDWWPKLSERVDDLAIVRSMWTTDNNHQAQYQFHSGRNLREGSFPSIGAWVHYGLGSLNENVPQFILFGKPLGTCCGGNLGHGADYLGPEHAAVRIDTVGNSPLPFVAPELRVLRQEQANEFALINRLSQQAAQAYPDDPETEARIKSYELAFKMQNSVPGIMDLSGETAETLQLYGLDRLKDNRAQFAKQCLLARRYVESGVRFIQVIHQGSGAGDWDAHTQLKNKYTDLCDEVDQPVAALLADLKRRGLLDETLVVFGTEFGRTPGLEVDLTPGAREGRDHHPYGFSVWMAGGGIKGGVVHGATDELGFHAVENRHYVTDIHATIMHQLGLEPKALDQPGRKRIERDYGTPIHEIIA